MNTFYTGDVLKILELLPSESVHCCVTSPPYWGLRDYGIEGQLGLEKIPEDYVNKLVNVFREVQRVLRDDGTLWLNLGDSYAKYGISGMGDPTIGKRNLGGMKAIKKDIPPGLKPKDLVGIPWMVAFALRTDGWYLRSDIVWEKPNAMPESVRDRPTKAHEYIFLFSKSKRYYYDADAIKEPVTKSTIARLSQDLEHQAGSIRANGGAKTNGPMKAVGGSKGAFGPPQSRKRSGNLQRKYGDDRGRPDSHLGGSIPWEGMTRNKRTVWNIATKPFKGAHFAVFPPELVEPCILAGSPMGGGSTGSLWW